MKKSILHLQIKKEKTIRLIISCFLFCLLLFVLVLLILDKNYSNAILSGINIFILYLLPTLFPYVILTSLMNSLTFPLALSKKLCPLSKKLFSLNEYTFYALFISMICGYPMGAKIICDLSSRFNLSTNEKIKLSILCSFSSPSYLISSIGIIAFDNVKFGITLYFIHITCSFIISILLIKLKYAKSDKISTNNTPLIAKPIGLENAFDIYLTVYNAVVSCLTIGGIIAFFALVNNLIISLNILSPLTKLFAFLFSSEKLANGFCVGLVECTSSIKIIASEKISFFTLPVLSFISGFGGVSVIFQVVAFLKKAKIKTAPFIVSQLLRAVLSFIIAIPFSLIFV